MGGVASQFHFLGFKIDSMSLWVKPTLGLLQYAGVIDPANLTIRVAFKKPLYFRTAKRYVGGMVLYIRALEKATAEAGATEGPATENPEVLKLDLMITGLFGVDDRMDKELEQKLVKIQIPAILFPYLRSAVSSVLACSGFAAPVLPLVNIQALAGSAEAELQIQDVE